MKHFTRIIAAVMAVAMLAAVMTACSKGAKDDRIIGTWKQTDDVDGNWTWTFEENGKCRLVGETTGFDSEGTYRIEEGNVGKIHINLDGWSEEKLFSYVATSKVLDLEEAFSSFHCYKQ